MLHQLLEYARRHNLVPAGFAPKNVRWAISCDQGGNFTGVLPLGEDRQGRRFAEAPDMSQPEMVRGGVTRSHFLVDTLNVVALFQPGDEGEAPPEKAQEKHAYFIGLLRQAATEIPYPELDAAVRLLTDESSLQAIRCQLREAGPPKAKLTDKCTVMVENRFPLDSDTWHDWWRAYRRQEAGPAHDTAKTMRCILTGDLVAPAKTHLKIMGLAGVGGRGPGDALISFDKESFESYGLKQSENAAMSEDTAKTYREALNTLIQDRGRQLTGTIVTHWYEEHVPQEDDPLSWIIETPEQEEWSAQKRAAELLKSIETGKRPPYLCDNYYYALTLSGNAGRVVIRDWMEGAFEDLVRNVAAWFEDLKIVHRDGGRVAPDPKFLAVAFSLYRDPKELPAPVEARLWRVAADNRPIPHSTLALAMNRARSDFIQAEPPNHARMGLIKAYHIRKTEGGIPMSPYLNEEHPDPAYHAGRLLAVLARLQQAALGDVGAGVVQRYYTGASQTPALVIGRLVANAQNHLNKLEGGLPHWFEERIAEVMGCIGDRLPSVLELEDQSLFALGYYQQLAQLKSWKAKEKEKNDA